MATISGTHSEDGTPTSGYLVKAYNYNARAIANASSLAGSDTTDGSGEWSIAGLNAELHLITITDPDDIKKMLVFEETAV